MKITNLVKTYKIKKGNSVRAVDNISFDLPNSGMVFLLGKSGSGKTTLLNLLGGLDFADSGDIVYEDKSLKNFSAKELDSYRNTYCGFVFQDYNLLPEFTVKENIALSLQIQGKSPTDEEISVALKEVDLEGYENRKITELSGGQKQRIAIVRALIKNPKILFADEPTGALDSATGDDILNILKKLSKDKLVIVVSHDREYAQKYADRIIELKDGKIISDTDTNFIQCKNESTYKSIKSGMPLKAALRIGISNFRLHPIKFIVTIILSVIAFSLFGVAFSMRTSNEDSILTNSLIDNNINYVTYERLYLKNEAKTVLNSRDTDIALLSLQTGLTYSPIRFDDYEIESFFDLSALENAYYAIMPSGATYFSLSQAENFGFSIIGSLPKSDNEVALTYFTASLFIRSGLAENDNVTIIDNERDLINKQITINGSIFTVVGIIDTKLDSSRYEVLKDTPMNFESTLINEYKSILCYSMHNVLIFNQSCFNAQSDSISLTQDFYIPTISIHYQPNIALKAENANIQKSFINDIDISKPYILLSSYNIYLALKDISCQQIYNQETYYSFGNLYNAYQKDYINSIIDQEYQIAVGNGYSGSKEEYKNYIISYKNNQYGKNYEQLLLQAFDQFKTEYEIPLNIEIKLSMSKFDHELNIFLGGFFASSTYTNDEVILFDNTSFETISNYYDGVFNIAIAPFDFGKNSAKDLLLIKIDENFGFGFTNYVITSLEDFRPNLEKLINIFGIISLVLAAFSIALFVYFISTSILDKSYTIGILRVLGCKAFDVITVFIIESLLLGILTVIFSELGTFIICTAINGFLLAKTGLLITILNANIFVFLSIFGIIITIAVLSGILSTAKLIKSMPLDFLKN